MIIRAIEENSEWQGLAEWGTGAIHSILSTTEQFKRYSSGEVISVVERIQKRFPDSKSIQNFGNSISRKEDPRVARAHSDGVCSLVYAPICSHDCPAWRGFVCDDCATVGLMWSCSTCDGDCSSKRYCDVCFHRCHYNHVGVSRFIPGTCVCHRVVCKKPL